MADDNAKDTAVEAYVAAVSAPARAAFMYPVPKSAALQRKLAPYIYGKGTLWFNLNEPLPESLIVAAVKDLAQI